MQKESRKFIDTNVLIYAEDKDDLVKYEIALKTIEESTKSSDGVISNQILAELSSQLQKAMSASEINERISDYIKAFDLVSYGHEEIKHANEISQANKLHFFDALIVSTMKKNGIDTIITENESDFKKISWLKIINPFK